MRYWIVNGIVHNAVEPEAVQTDLLIENGVIASIGKAPAGVECVDVKGLHIFPGLIDAHCHLGLHGYAVKYEGLDINEHNDCLTPELRAVDGFNPMDPTLENARRGGVTCVGTGPGSANVIGGTFMAVKTSGICVDDMIVKEKVAMKCAFGENPKNCHKGKSIDTRMTTAAKMREILFKAREYMRKKERAAGDESKMPDFNFRYEALLGVLRKEIPLKAHAHQANDILTSIRIAREFDLDLTLEHCTEGHLIADILGKYPYPVAVGPNLMHASKPELRNRSFVTPGILDKAGCHVSIITDSPVMPQEQLSLSAALAVKAGMDPFSALKAITINPAEHLGIAERVGSIEAGKDADLVICDGDILSPMTRIHQVYINGKEVL